MTSFLSSLEWPNKLLLIKWQSYHLSCLDVIKLSANILLCASFQCQLVCQSRAMKYFVILFLIFLGKGKKKRKVMTAISPSVVRPSHSLRLSISIKRNRFRWDWGENFSPKFVLQPGTRCKVSAVYEKKSICWPTSSPLGFRIIIRK